LEVRDKFEVEVQAVTVVTVVTMLITLLVQSLV